MVKEIELKVPIYVSKVRSYTYSIFSPVLISSGAGD